MFSGKSEELIRRLKRARIARQRVACYKPDIDLRYHRTAIASHSSQTHEVMTVSTARHLQEELFPQLGAIDMVWDQRGAVLRRGRRGAGGRAWCIRGSGW